MLRLVAIAALLGSSLVASSQPGQEVRWLAEPVARAGAVDGPGALALVFDVEVAPHGELLAAQPVAGTIAVFDSAGRYLRSVGRRGAGPGEFQQLGGLSRRGDTLVVVDLGRLHLFSAGFDHLTTFTFPSLDPPRDVGRIIPGAVLADGSLLGVPMFARPGRAAPVLRLSRSGSIEDTIMHVLEDEPYVSLSVAGQNRPMNVAKPWRTSPLWAPSVDGRSLLLVRRPIARAPDDARFDVLRIGMMGDTLTNVAIDYQPIELSAEQRDRTYATIARRSSRDSDAVAARIEREVRGALPAPRFLPPVTRIVAGRDGTIWLRREDTDRETVEWQVLSRSAQPLAKISLPSEFDLRRAQSDRIWGIADSLDVPYVRVYHVRPQGDREGNGNPGFSN